MQGEDHPDDLDEDDQHAGDLATARHLEEDPEDIEREKRDDHLLDDARDDLLDVDDDLLERCGLQVRYAQA